MLHALLPKNSTLSYDVDELITPVLKPEIFFNPPFSTKNIQIVHFNPNRTIPIDVLLIKYKPNKYDDLLLLDSGINNNLLKYVDENITMSKYFDILYSYIQPIFSYSSYQYVISLLLNNDPNVYCCSMQDLHNNDIIDIHLVKDILKLPTISNSMYIKTSNDIIFTPHGIFAMLELIDDVQLKETYTFVMNVNKLYTQYQKLLIDKLFQSIDNNKSRSRTRGTPTASPRRSPTKKKNKFVNSLSINTFDCFGSMLDSVSSTMPNSPTNSMSNIAKYITLEQSKIEYNRLSVTTSIHKASSPMRNTKLIFSVLLSKHDFDLKIKSFIDMIQNECITTLRNKQINHIIDDDSYQQYIIEVRKYPLVQYINDEIIISVQTNLENNINVANNNTKRIKNIIKRIKTSVSQ